MLTTGNSAQVVTLVAAAVTTAAVGVPHTTAVLTVVQLCAAKTARASKLGPKRVAGRTGITAAASILVTAFPAAPVILFMAKDRPDIAGCISTAAVRKNGRLSQFVFVTAHICKVCSFQ